MQVRTIFGLILATLVGYSVHAVVPPYAPEPVTTDVMGEHRGAESNHSSMQPEPVPAPTDQPVPEIRIEEAFADRMGAYSVRVALDNFTITPAKIDRAPVPNEGHLHVYVDGKKVGRAYAEWIYVPASFFSAPGPHQITVSVHANTHGIWTFGGAPIQDAIRVE